MTQVLAHNMAHTHGTYKWHIHMAHRSHLTDHGAHSNESCHTFKWVMSHIQMNDVTWITHCSKCCHALLKRAQPATRMKHVNESHMYSPLIHVNESHVYSRLIHANESHMYSRLIHVNESCHAINHSCHTYQCIMAHMSVSHNTRQVRWGITGRDTWNMSHLRDASELPHLRVDASCDTCVCVTRCIVWHMCMCY